MASPVGPLRPRHEVVHALGIRRETAKAFGAGYCAGREGLSNDMRTLLASDNAHAKEAVDLFVYRICRELGSLAAALGGLDALSSPRASASTPRRYAGGCVSKRHGSGLRSIRARTAVAGLELRERAARRPRG